MNNFSKLNLKQPDKKWFMKICYILEEPEPITNARIPDNVSCMMI